MNTHIGLQIGWRRKKINLLEQRKCMLNVQIGNLYDEIKNLEKMWHEQKLKSKEMKQNDIQRNQPKFLETREGRR